MRSIRLHTTCTVTLLALALLVPASVWAADAAATGAPAGAATGTGSSAAGSGEVAGQNPQLSKLTGEQTPEEQQEELAEKNAAAVKATESKPISTGLLVLIATVAVALIGGIAFLIMRDARSVAPAGGLPGSGSVRDQAARQRQRRAKAKAARQARKRNR